MRRWLAWTDIIAIIVKGAIRRVVMRMTVGPRFCSCNRRLCIRNRATDCRYYLLRIGPAIVTEPPIGARLAGFAALIPLFDFLTDPVANVGFRKSRKATTVSLQIEAIDRFPKPENPRSEQIVMRWPVILI